MEIQANEHCFGQPALPSRPASSSAKQANSDRAISNAGEDIQTQHENSSEHVDGDSPGAELQPGLDRQLSVEKDVRNKEVLMSLVLTEEFSRGCSHLQAAVTARIPALVTGPAKCGKLSLVQYCAAKHDKELFVVHLGPHSTIAEIVGGVTIKTDQTLFDPGPLVYAVSSGAWLVLRGLELAPDTVQQYLQHALYQINGSNSLHLPSWAIKLVQMPLPTDDPDIGIMTDVRVHEKFHVFCTSHNDSVEPGLASYMIPICMAGLEA